jgi:hypothetical protein
VSVSSRCKWGEVKLYKIININGERTMLRLNILKDGYNGFGIYTKSTSPDLAQAKLEAEDIYKKEKADLTTIFVVWEEEEMAKNKKVLAILTCFGWQEDIANQRSHPDSDMTVTRNDFDSTASVVGKKSFIWGGYQ